MLVGCTSLINIKDFPLSSSLLSKEPKDAISIDLSHYKSYEPPPPENISFADGPESNPEISFELALKESLKDYKLPAEPLVPDKCVLFSFSDLIVQPQEPSLPDFRQASLKADPPLKLKEKKGGLKIQSPWEQTKEEIKPYHFYLNNLWEVQQNSLNNNESKSDHDFSPADTNFSSPKEASPTSTGDSSGEKLSSIVSIFPSVLNEKVKDFINYFQNEAGSFFTKALARSQAYEEMMKRIFREKNLPEELFYLALIESGFNPFATSRAQASGIWQFISKTAKRFGLRVDKWVDERRDPEKSTYAAADYLKQLYEMFNCWELAAAGYNAGEGKILRALQKTKSQNFWEIAQHRYLKSETKKYVPMFLAAMLIAKEPEKYGFSNIPYQPPLSYEKIIVPPSTSLAWVAKVTETDLAELQALNPSLKMGKTPPQGEFEIKLPLGKREVFEKNLAMQKRLASSSMRKHQVRPGERLWSIARRYKVSLNQLCELNGFTPNTKLRPGLVILLPH